MALADIRDIDFNDFGSWPIWFKIAMAAVICVSILFAGYWFIVKDQIADLERHQKQEVSLKKTFLDKKALAINLEAYRQQMKEMQETFGAMLRQLPNKTEVPELLIDITQAGLGRGLQFQLFKPKSRRVADFYAQLPIDLKVRGSYHQLGGFVSDLAALPRIVTVGNLSLKRPKGSGLLEMSAVISTYHYLDEETIAKRKQAAQKKSRKKRRGP